MTPLIHSHVKTQQLLFIFLFTEGLHKTWGGGLAGGGWVVGSKAEQDQRLKIF